MLEFLISFISDNFGQFADLDFQQLPAQLQELVNAVDALMNPAETAVGQEVGNGTSLGSN